MTTYRCMIIEDEPLACELLSSYIQKVPYLNLLSTYDNAIEAFSAIQTTPVDILFLDVEMPGMSGLELLRSLKHKPHVIIVSAYAEHAVEGFNLDVVDYLLKPVLFERFMKALGKITAPASESVHFTSEKESSTPSRPYIFFRVNKESVKVYLDEILWIESLKDYVKIKTIHADLISYQRISFLEEKLPILYSCAYIAHSLLRNKK